ncbi:hypothetical protein LSH36_148g05024 [Paralvinella palmiformis]|uniref:Methyltransferase domain-containing protein n=1 Tax=Paralvinella palmiformis TaxID=53620 RepID=A0AAD9N7H4_9ANNE|nr:hypothetical protein LSH36_148g05024 [Paralvinella palmiformis]
MGAIFRLPETDFFKRWEERKEQACHKMIDVLIKHVPELQGGLERGINVLDVGCGRGHFLFAMAAEYPECLFTGIDINESLIGDARDQARERMLRDLSLTNIGFAAYDAAILPAEWSRRFDVVMMHEVCYDLPSPADVLQEVGQVLRPGGVLLVVERSIYGDPRRNLGEHAQRITALIAPIVSMNYSLPVAMSQPEGDAEALGLCSGKEKLVQVIRDADFDDLQTFDFTVDEQKVEILIAARQTRHMAKFRK